jgi:hypothetical protein
MLGSVCCIKQFNLGGKHFADDKEVEMEVQKWPSDFYAAGFNALVK